MSPKKIPSCEVEIMQVHEVRIVNIKKVLRETPQIRTFLFEDSLCEEAEPGQYIMCWLPNIDEIPLSLSVIGKNSGVTVEKVGKATKLLCKKTEGDHFGIRGPYGNGFDIVKGKNVAIVAGGIGICPLQPLISRLVNFNSVTLFFGCKTKKDIPFLEELREAFSLGETLHITTEDGSLGKKGMVTSLLDQQLREEKFEKIYTCGPEPMMVKVVSLADKYGISLQASLERYIKCGIGLCGSCMLGPYRVCQDGPVFNAEELKKTKDFGNFKRNKAGKRVDF